MHRALGTPEIVLEIIEQIRSSTALSRDVSSALLAFALTSRQFKESALDALWYRMDNLEPLFKLLTNFSPSSVPGSKGHLQGIIPKDDLVRFHAYSARIRSYSANALDSVSTSSHMRVLHAGANGTLLPRLHRLFVPFPSDRDELFFFLHPGLSELILSNLGRSMEGFCCAVFASSLPVKCPALKLLEIEAQNAGGIYAGDGALSLCESVAQMQHLEVLRLISYWGMQVPDNFLSSLRSSLTLTDLTIAGLIRTPFKMKSACTSPLALTKFSITLAVENLPFQNGSIFGWDDLPALKTLRLTFAATGKLSEAQIDACLALCTSFCTMAPSLSHLSIANRALFIHNLSFPFSSIIGLVNPMLRSLQIGHGVSPSLQIGDFAQLSRLPTLQQFKYYSGRVDAKTLAYAAATFTKLTTLGLTVDSIHFPSIDHLPLPDNSINKLVLSGKLEDPIQTASCLNRLFPHLSSLETVPFSSSLYIDWDAWRMMERVLRALWKARDDEMRRREMTQRGVRNVGVLGNCVD